jgi:hypothetical protein
MIGTIEERIETMATFRQLESLDEIALTCCVCGKTKTDGIGNCDEVQANGTLLPVCDACVEAELEEIPSS